MLIYGISARSRSITLHLPSTDSNSVIVKVSQSASLIGDFYRICWTSFEVYVEFNAHAIGIYDSSTA